MINNLGVTEITNLANSVQNWNSQLPVRAGEFMAANSEAKVTIVDTHSAWEAALGNRKAYGVFDSDCKSTDCICSSLWWDEHHAGTAMQRLVAEAVAEALKGSFF